MLFLCFGVWHSTNYLEIQIEVWLNFPFSDSTGQTNCTLCPLGYYCVENSTAFSEQLCPPGYYCPVGTSNPYQYPCPKGTYNPVNASHSLTDCLTCPPGQYCESKCSHSLFHATKLFRNGALTYNVYCFIRDWQFSLRNKNVYGISKG